MENASIIQFINVTKQYDDETLVLDNVSFEIERGKFYTLLGPSGCGKTTILRLIAGFTEATSGDIYFWQGTDPFPKQDLAISAIPSTLSYNEAVSLPFGGNTALHFLRKMENKKDSNLLIYGASGLVGTASVQIAKLFGFNVTVVCSLANRSLMHELGICNVFDYAKHNWMTDVGKFDYIFDAVGITTKKEWNAYLNSHDKFYSIAKGLVKPNPTDLEFLLDLAGGG